MRANYFIVQIRKVIVKFLKKLRMFIELSEKIHVSSAIDELRSKQDIFGSPETDKNDQFHNPPQ